jgi:hypothetical protein
MSATCSSTACFWRSYCWAMRSWTWRRVAAESPDGRCDFLADAAQLDLDFVSGVLGGGEVRGRVDLGHVLLVLLLDDLLLDHLGLARVARASARARAPCGRRPRSCWGLPAREREVVGQVLRDRAQVFLNDVLGLTLGVLATVSAAHLRERRPVGGVLLTRAAVRERQWRPGTPGRSGPGGLHAVARGLDRLSLVAGRVLAAALLDRDLERGGRRPEVLLVRPRALDGLPCSPARMRSGPWARAPSVRRPGSSCASRRGPSSAWVWWRRAPPLETSLSPPRAVCISWRPCQSRPGPPASTPCPSCRGPRPS